MHPPQIPSAEWRTYYTAGCPETCFGGCFSSMWSEMYTWHGQGINLGAPDDDALFVWPGFKSNVTIKACRTVVLDINLDVQLYSLVVWGVLDIENRPDAIINLRSVCINIKPGGKIVAGSAVNLRKRDWQLLRRVAEARSDEKGGRRSVSKVIEGLIDAHRSTLEAEASR